MVFTAGSITSKSSLGEDTGDRNSERFSSQGEVVNKAERHAGEGGVTLKLSSVSKKKDLFLLRSHQALQQSNSGHVCDQPGLPVPKASLN